MKKGPNARPIGSQRAFISIPAAIAGRAPPPASSTVSAANCAAPEHTMIDITIGAIEPMTGCASTPNEAPMRMLGRTIGSPALIPARKSSEVFIGLAPYPILSS